MTTFTIPKPEHGSADWLRVRWVDDTTGLKRVSASNAAAVHGEHRYTTKAALAAELLAVEPPQPKQATEAMARGNTLEPALISWLGQQLADQNMTVHVADDVMYVAGRMIATLDAVVFDGPLAAPGECKTTKDLWRGELSPTWHWQGVQQAICTDSDIVWWAILDGDLRLHLHRQDVTADDKRAHTTAVEEFLSWIDMGVFPPDASPSAADIATVYPQAEAGSSVAFSDDDMQWISELRQAKAEVKKWQAAEKAAQGEIARLLGDAETGLHNGQPVVTWKTQTRAEYTVAASTSRVMRLAKEKT